MLRKVVQQVTKDVVKEAKSKIPSTQLVIARAISREKPVYSKLKVEFSAPDVSDTPWSSENTDAVLENKQPKLVFRVQNAGSDNNKSAEYMIKDAIALSNKNPKGLPKDREEQLNKLVKHHLDNDSKSVSSFTSDIHQPLRRIGFYKTASDNKENQYLIFVRKFDEKLVSIEPVLAERNVKGFSDAKGEYVLPEAIGKEDLLAAFTPAGFKKFKNGELAENLLTGKQVRFSDIEALALPKISSDKVDFEEHTKDFDPRAFKL